jgi:hypothetical protein
VIEGAPAPLTTDVSVVTVDVLVADISVVVAGCCAIAWKLNKQSKKIIAVQRNDE